MQNERRRYRMYGLTPYNISPIQQAIQFGHAVVEYGLLHGRTSAYNDWAVNDKTFIILNGGTTNFSVETPGTLNQHVITLVGNGVPYSTFHEPDLGDQLTAVVFLVDDRVWDKETWPDYNPPYEEWRKQKEMIRKNPDELAAIMESFESYRIWLNNFSSDVREAEHIVWMRSFLRNFKLA